MPTRNRREFLLQVAALSTAAATPRLLSQITNASAKPGQKIRGLMLDAARLPEPIAYYKRVVDFCAEWQLNTIQFRVADDQGTALRFASVNDLVTHKNAFTPHELEGLVAYGHSHGVDIIPELESFGHTGFITRSPTYAHLLDDDTTASREFTGIIPVHPETLQLFTKLYAELATIFPSTYLHGGCDEVNWGGSALSRRALQTKSRAQIWAEYLNSLDKIATDLGRQFIVWGDLVLHKEPSILPRLNKDIIIMDWNYVETDSARLSASMQQIKANGSRAIGGPALVNYQWGARVGDAQLRNVDAFADAYTASNDPATMGVILTNWVPSRYAQNSIWDGFAYAATAFNHGASTARKDASRLFVEKHYRSRWSDAWKEAFAILYQAAPSIHDSSASRSTPQSRIPWSDDAQLTGLLHRTAAPGNQLKSLRSLLSQLQPTVTRNLADFRALELSVDYLQAVIDRETAVIDLVGKPTQKELFAAAIKHIAAKDQALAKALSADWDETRFADSPAKTVLLAALEPKDQLLYQWNRAAAYSSSLAANADRFYNLLTAAKPA
jgi:hypothetical protein